MIRISDMTLSCIEVFRPSIEQLKQLYILLCSLGTDSIEVPVPVYEAIQPASPDKIVLRIGTPEISSQFPEISRFVCRMNGLPSNAGIIREIQMNDVKELSFFRKSDGHENIRVVGLDDILCHDYEAAFQKLLRCIKGRIELCPENSYSCATAAALEWINTGGTDLAVSFGGIGGKAALEEVLLSLRVIRRHKPTASYQILPQIALLIEEITGVRFPDRKAVIGRNIFNVESGIHVDGILKKPQMYEPYQPELVGGHRRLIVGKHSGRKSIAAKLGELGYSSADFNIAHLLSAVRLESVGKMTSLTDEAFMEIAEHHRL
jgi:homocitrate synthase NifV